MIHRFDGSIAAMGSTSGARLVVGDWRSDLFGAFSDVMIERGDGHRILIAPTTPIAEFVASTYTFDEVRIEPVTVTPGRSTRVSTTSLELSCTLGRLHPVSWPLAVVPGPIRDTEAFARFCDPIARRLMPGVRTHGSAGRDRTEWYAARRVRRIVALSARLDGADCGALAPVDPPVRFGFGSAPRMPCVTSIRTMVRMSPKEL